MAVGASYYWTMDDSGTFTIQSLEQELFHANYRVRYYSEKFVDLSVQVEQLSKFAADNTLNDLTLYLSKHISDSKSQLLQDLLVSFLFQERTGFFCEFGAADGLSLSNTYFLEKLGWNGILCEPSVRWHDLLSGNRNCKISHDCVYPTSGKQLMFNEVDEGMFSSLLEFSESDMHAHRRVNGFEYLVNSISLEDLLRKQSAPSHIDFLSIDTEGSEYAILESFNFELYSFGAIFVEHNFTENREKIYKLLTKNGYLRVFGKFSRWDDWYLSRNQYDVLKSKVGAKELI